MPKSDVVKIIDLRRKVGTKTAPAVIINQTTGEGSTPEEIGEIVQDEFLTGNSDRVYFGASTWLTAQLSLSDVLMNVDSFLFEIGDYVVLQHETATAEVVLITDLSGAQYTVERAQFGTVANAFQKYKTKVTRIFNIPDSGNVVAQSAGNNESPYTSTWILDDDDSPLWKTSVGRLIEATQAFKDNFPFWIGWDNVLGFAGDKMRALEANIVYGRVEHDLTSHRWFKGTGWDEDDNPSAAGGEVGGVATGLGIDVLNKAGFPWAAWVTPYTSEIENLLFYVDTNKAERILQYEYLDNTDEWFFRVGGIRQKRDHLAFHGSTPIEKPVIEGSISGVGADLLTALDTYGLIDNQTVLGGGDDLEFTDIKTTDYQAAVNELVLVGDHATTLTVTAPVSPNKDDIFGIKITTATTQILDVSSGSAVEIESPYSGMISDTTVGMSGINMAVLWQYDGLNRWRVISSAKVGKVVEFWIANAMTDIGDVPTIITWTFNDEISTLTTPVIGSYLNGVWTLDRLMRLSAELKVYTEFDLSANNMDGSILVNDNFTGAGDNIFLPAASAIAHSRSGLFYISSAAEGGYITGPGNQLSFTAQSGVAQNGVTNLNQATLILSFG